MKARLHEGYVGVKANTDYERAFFCSRSRSRCLILRFLSYCFLTFAIAISNLIRPSVVYIETGTIVNPAPSIFERKPRISFLCKRSFLVRRSSYPSGLAYWYGKIFALTKY